MDYSRLIDELESIVKAEGVTQFAEQDPDVDKQIQYWREQAAKAAETK